MDGLSPETRALLARAEEGEGMVDERRRALRMRIAGALGIAAPLAAVKAPAASPGGQGAARWPASARWLRWGHWGAAAHALGAVGVAVAVTAVVLTAAPARLPVRVTANPRDVRPPPAQVATALTATSAGLQVPSLATSPAPLILPAPSEAETAKASPARSSRTRVLPSVLTPAAPSRADSANVAPQTRAAQAGAMSSGLGAEAHLLASAQSALAYGNPGQALTFLNEYDERFSTGTLAPESGALRVSALCAAGRVEEARAAAARVRARFPTTLVTTGAASSCAAP